ncbi:AraC family transcriptional regulator [Chryseobacterium formosense]|uniref:AraC family transcriptional regulator n=1 Tax=Chryseobacterium formosense TaxID=236814 RepID=A0A085Z862_9FLAO|nr:AraC family transcriptional regulator [Chryseobacterium formosense]KFF00626.1 AraC family transcriptional regulator [Chryseobacterium formosense]SFT35844.1 Helix-turn-helix domain-containing protein [Chryseobacterium formosense]
MKKDKNIPYIYNSLTELHRMLGLSKPLHPLISLFDNTNRKIDYSNIADLRTSAFYKISYKSNLTGQLKYGQHYYDFDEGGLFFVSPNQVTANSDNNGDHSGYTLLIHPDFLLSYPLANKIKKYGFFSYSADEALHLSDKEKDTIISIFKNIDEELQSRIDDFSQDVMISQIETLLNYSNRFYKRQFITRKQANNDLLQKMEGILEGLFKDENLAIQGIPTVQHLSESLHLSPSYLSDMLRSLTGQNAQQHIQNKIIEKAKEKLSTSNLSISEIAYELGFEYSQSFSRLFKAKTSQSPQEFRAGFN